jgi:SAM-dependent methyltransferase
MAHPLHGRIVDPGCGEGGDLLALAETSADRAVSFVGLDVSPRAISQASEAARGDGRLELAVADLAEPLPFGDGEVDQVMTHNLLECLPDPHALALEIGRILRPGGTVVAAHVDWDTQCFNGSDTALTRRVLNAFSDWQQDWMEQCDGWMGRRLWGTFHPLGLFDGTVRARAMVETEFSAGSYGRARVEDCRGLADRGLLAESDYESFVADLGQAAEKGEYFYSVTTFAYVGCRGAK